MNVLLNYSRYKCEINIIIIFLTQDMKFNEVMPSDILMKQLELASSCPPKVCVVM